MARKSEPVVEDVELDELKPHPRNYRTHGSEQLRHLAQSIREHGQYRNVVIARDGTILAGHGVWLAAREAGLTTIRAVRLSLEPDDPRAIKLLVADNELARFAGVDDRRLSELLRDVRELDINALLGTGYDDAMLANLLLVTRPASELADFDAAAEWVGMPEYEPTASSAYRIVVHLQSERDRDRFLKLIGVELVDARNGNALSLHWPEQDSERRDTTSLRFREAS
jgi:hypothetical protein